MLSVWTIATSLVLHAATVSPRSLPARGQAEALVTIDRAAMVRLTATSPRGTRCELVDQLRGPFSSSGGVGGKSCDFDQLLDAGTYKLRVSSPDDGTGTVVISARPFPEVNPQALKLALHGTVELFPSFPTGRWNTSLIWTATSPDLLCSSRSLNPPGPAQLCRS